MQKKPFPISWCTGKHALTSNVFRFRVAVHFVVTYPFFDTFIMLIIIGSSIALAAEDPVDEKSERNQVLTYFDYIFTCIFAVEMVLKVSSI